LLDQTVLRGVGNIYADESLWRAKIHPAKLGARISKKQAAVLHRALQDILKKAIVMRGSSIANFVDGEGQPGEYQQHHRAYGREGKKCYRCGTIIRRAVVAGAAAFFAPNARLARAVSWPDLPCRRNRNVNRPIVAARKTLNHPKIGRDWQLAVDGKNKVNGKFCRQETLLRERG